MCEQEVREKGKIFSFPLNLNFWRKLFNCLSACPSPRTIFSFPKILSSYMICVCFDEKLEF